MEFKLNYPISLLDLCSSRAPGNFVSEGEFISQLYILCTSNFCLADLALHEYLHRALSGHSRIRGRLSVSRKARKNREVRSLVESNVWCQILSLISILSLVADWGCVLSWTNGCSKGRSAAERSDSRPSKPCYHCQSELHIHVVNILCWLLCHTDLNFW